ncbi:MAG TPA: right-handed parallel beta-helix repeat-containing protein [Actinomycetota bacterium]|nr:right-handed parallel beta-helix repeat-containing protein [Actinomycetota bacterium]
MRRRPFLRGAIAVAAVVPALLLGTPAHADEGYGATVSAVDDAFDQQVVRIQPGQTVEWTNDGHADHAVTADDGSFDSGRLTPGGGFEQTFATPGVYPYYCRYHGTPGHGMIGTIVVGDVPLPGPSGGVGPGHEPPPTRFAPTVRVPQDFATIQAGVDHARPGGMVLIAPGVYHESVTVTTPYLTIRGADRNRTILDGGFTEANGIAVFEADGVTIQNLTARRFALNGFYWNDVHGYWGSYLTAEDNGDYGIFAFASDYGQFDHSYASGSPDSGFYIGQCDPCHAVITDVTAEGNAAGFSGTNAGGDLAIVNSEWTGNLAGIVPNTLDSEAGPPQHDVLIAGNVVHDNGSPSAPTLPLTYPAFGVGILVTGGRDDVVTGNLVEDQPAYGIAVLPIIDRNLWTTAGNRITDNVVRRSGLADLALGAPSAGGDCFAGNTHGSSQPPAIQLLYPCSGIRPFPGGGGSIAPTLEALARYLDAQDGTFPHGDWRTGPSAPPQPQLPGDPAKAPPVPAIAGQNVPQPYRIRPVEELRAPAGPTVGKELAVMGMPLATSWWSLLLGLYGYVLPFVLYASWVAVAMWDLIRQESAAIAHRARWMLVVLAVPFVGPLLYFAFGRSPIPRQLRLILTVGGIAIYAVFVLLGALLGG